jgi:hypothetical protein
MAVNDEALDWDCPQNGLLWTCEQQKHLLKKPNRYTETLQELDRIIT